jgi:phage tail sheath gpL-like
MYDNDDEIELRLNTLTILFFVERQWKQFVRCFPLHKLLELVRDILFLDFVGEDSD